MELQKQVVFLELAKRLKELGVPQVGLYAWDTSQEPHKLRKGGIVRNPAFKAITAFTVAELGEMLRESYYSKWETTWDSIGDNWRGSLNTGTTNDGQLIHHWVDANTEADARAKCLIYLLENELITL